MRTLHCEKSQRKHENILAIIWSYFIILCSNYKSMQRVFFSFKSYKIEGLAFIYLKAWASFVLGRVRYVRRGRGHVTDHQRTGSSLTLVVLIRRIVLRREKWNGTGGRRDDWSWSDVHRVGEGIVYLHLVGCRYERRVTGFVLVLTQKKTN